MRKDIGSTSTLAGMMPANNVIEPRANMGMFAEVAGWLRLDEEGLAKAQEIVKADLDGLGHYGASWCAQAQGGGHSRHLFFGSSVRESEVERVRAQVARIAAGAFSTDGDCVDYPAGLFRVEYESEGAPVEVWQISDGALRVEKGG